MNAIELSIALIAHTGFLILTRPSAANSNFPYHVKTSQIGCVMEPDGTLQNNVDGFAHHGINGNIFQSERHQTNFDELFTVGYNSSQETAAVNKYSGQATTTTSNGRRTDADITSLFQVNGQNGSNNVNK